MQKQLLPQPAPHAIKPWVYLALVGLAYLFALGIRLVAVARFGDDARLLVNGEMPLAATDGFYYASAVKAEIADVLHQNYRVMDWRDSALTVIAWFLSGALGFSLDTVIVYLPVVLAAFVVVPVCGIGRALNAPLWGFGAALIAGIGWSYYNRTMLGYFDTDAMAVTLPLMTIWGLITATVSQPGERLTPIAWAAATIAVGPFVYHQADVVHIVVVALYTGYSLLFHRRDSDLAGNLLLVWVALVGAPVEVRLALVVGLWLVLRRWAVPTMWLVLSCVATMAVVLATNVKMGFIVERLGLRLQAGGGALTEESTQLHFQNPKQLTRELRALPLDQLASRVSGSLPLLIVASVGWLMAVLRHRILLLTAPLVALGLFTALGGLRYTIYAVPIAALGAAWIALAVPGWLSRRIPHAGLRHGVAWGLSALGLTLMLLPHVEHATTHAPRASVSPAEAELMEALAGTLQPQDLTLAWWDFGYPLWYYAGATTFIDGGRHNRDNYLIAKITQTTSQRQAANLARLAVETYAADNPYQETIDLLARRFTSKDFDVNAFLASLADEAYTPPPRTRDIYLYLPQRMLKLTRAIHTFIQRDLVTGQKGARPFWYYARAGVRDGRGRFRMREATARQDEIATLSLDAGLFEMGGRKAKLKAVHFARRNKHTDHPESRTTTLHADGLLHAIFLQDAGVIVTDQTLFDSVLVQLYALGRHDPRFFEVVVANPAGVVYRVLR